jgi:hypothetical protein
MTFLVIDSLVTELTPYSRVLHKLYCRQLLKNFLTLTATMFHYLFRNSLPLSQNPVHILPYYFLRSVLVLSSRPGSVYHVRGFIILGFFKYLNLGWNIIDLWQRKSNCLIIFLAIFWDDCAEKNSDMAYGAGDKEQLNLMEISEELWFFLPENGKRYTFRNVLVLLQSEENEDTRYVTLIISWI